VRKRVLNLKKIGAARNALTPGELAQIEACRPIHGAAGFRRFCGHCKVFDKELRKWVRFDLWPGQETLAD